MSGESVLDQFRPKRSVASLASYSKVSSSTVKRPVAAAPAGCCEFVRELVCEGGAGRYCVNGTFCAASEFSDAKVFGTCPVRLEKLRGKEA